MANNTTDSNLPAICTTVDYPEHTYTRNPLPASADKVNKLLQENHTKFHAFFNYHEITHGIFQHVCFPFSSRPDFPSLTALEPPRAPCINPFRSGGLS